MIKPTIFIGLGTTGMEILKTLRQLMSEEYSHAGLRVFRYISIETQDSETGDNPRNFKDYERVEVVNATIEDLALIQNRLDPDQPYYNLQLAEWLNSALLNEFESFKDGARNIRMAGRLCLWENWVEISRTLSRAFNHIINPANIDKTREILHQHYEAKNLDAPIQLVDHNGINVYVFGALCGGTCSGMFIDIAYALRNLLDVNYPNNIHGIFTMYDRFSAENIYEEQQIVRAANCYASLSELNYYNHPNTMYDITFPSGLRVNTLQKPYNYEWLVSPSGKNYGIRFVSDFGDTDEYGLNLMVALNLFAEAAGDTGGYKRAIRTDWIGSEGYGELKPVPVGEIPTMTRCLASFGLTAVWYPKYRIANAAAYSASIELCNQMKSKHTTDEDIRAYVINEWNRIRNNADILTSPQIQGRPTLEDEVTTHLDNLKDDVLDRKLSAWNLEKGLELYPKGEAGSFRQRFSMGGAYYAWIEGKVDSCKKAFGSVIDSALQNQLSRVFNSPNTYGIGDVQRFFEELDLVIKTTQGRIENKLPTLNLDTLDFGAMRRAERNPWITALGYREKAVNSHRESLIEEYRKLIIGESVGIYHKVRYYFLQQVLDDVRAKLGFEGSTEINTIKQQLDQIEANLKNCSQVLQEEYKYAVAPPKYECVKIVTNNPENNIETDAESLSDQISNDITSAGLLVENGNPITMATFLKKGHEDLMRQMTETLQRVALDKINNGRANGTAVTKVQEILNTDGEDIRNLARRSNPYIEFSPMYEALALDWGTKIVLGHDPIGQSLEDLKDALYFDRTGNSFIDNLTFFYEEEAGFAPDDLAAYELLKHHFERMPGIYGHLTHQDPSFYNLTFQHKKQKLQQWCNVLASLVPLIWEHVTPDAFGDVFRREDDKCIVLPPEI